MNRISIVLPDCTRPLPFEQVLPILERVFPNLEHWVIGLGLHRALTPSEHLRFQSHTTKPIVEHDPDNCTDICSTGDPSFGIFSPLLETDWTLTVGVMEVHQYAGVSGGYKGVVVGCGSRKSIAHLHRRELVCDPNVEVGRIEGNPFRAEIERLGKTTPCRFGLQWVPSLQEWWFGTPEALLDEAKQHIKPWYWIHEQVDTVILSVPDSKGQTLYQASRAATYLALSPNPPLKERGTIVLKASLMEGIGSEQGFVDALNRFRPPYQECLTQELSGAGSQRIWMLARLMKRFNLVLMGVKNPTEFETLGFRVVEDGLVEPVETALLVKQPFDRIPQYSTILHDIQS